ncbi:hypothetical protein [Stenotrophomonas phage BUCT627]|uniref:Uncharacterized protein n=2 Tax=Bixiavirus TaxID=3044676 RepID=A0A7D2LKQ7_9CAUD|nr:hypothetical protein PQD75_gp031 [Stenotrophomonas phage vB_SmaS_BUCT548]YP_010677489.1 hypothetical protein PQD77_gp070 [Stenotrophomonas phage BUCT627]QIQ60841.1 hypothetical protein [Stenotrophomonas phage vB_SmaS_BUCT548]QYC96689.1 hypothetical protein [Stenotrophomonas phage BUCT627]
MAKERVRNFTYRVKDDQGNFRMRRIGYFGRWVIEQGNRLGIGVTGVINTLHGGATFEIVEGSKGPQKPTVVTQAKIVGTGKVGEALTVTAGTWEGDPPINEGYDWLVDGTAYVSGPSMTPVEEQIGKKITLRVQGQNDVGSTVYNVDGPTVTAA